MAPLPGDAAHAPLFEEVGSADEFLCPSARFGANAAWLRLQVLTFNLLELLKAVALDLQYRSARPKPPRFAFTD